MLCKASRDYLFNSHVGYHGGNYFADFWVCGLEHGTGGGHRVIHHSRPITHPPYWTDQFHLDCPDSTSWQFEQKVARIYNSYKGDDSIISIDRVKEIVKNDLYRQHGNTFKLNLFPLAFPGTAPIFDKVWTEDLWDLNGEPTTLAHWTGLPSVQAYREYCRKEGRFDWIRGLVRDHKPKIIMGVGKAFWADYMLAFSNVAPGQHQSDIFKEHHILPSGKDLIYYKDHNSNSHVFLTHYLGGQGMNSSTDLRDLGKIMRKKVGDK